MFAAQEKANQLKELQNLKKSMTSTTPTRGSEPHRRFNVFLKKKFGRKTIRNTEIDESDEPYNDEDSEAEEGEIQELDDLDLYVVDSEQPAWTVRTHPHNRSPRTQRQGTPNKGIQLRSNNRRRIRPYRYHLS
jgi:hypothetical protein